jgi:hypothetical protein
MSITDTKPKKLPNVEHIKIFPIVIFLLKIKVVINEDKAPEAYQSVGNIFFPYLKHNLIKF